MPDAEANVNAANTKLNAATGQDSADDGMDAHAHAELTSTTCQPADGDMVVHAHAHAADAELNVALPRHLWRELDPR